MFVILSNPHIPMVKTRGFTGFYSNAEFPGRHGAGYVQVDLIGGERDLVVVVSSVGVQAVFLFFIAEPG